ncbi:hypothetical protein RsS62_43360 [Rhizobium dioscoreae]|uniref:Uncharacterized protein n=1 Tax=Rhizobium dioscoreae TaxID=2653122 RepID=A0ABQ0YYW8_9HYPH|nr:hypothetical protein RsS62_43360 [Rhizobium dioscoreae]GES48434.1 hypothetical protein RsS93_10480 [Rhizobium dioscoreae]GLU79096.1 hypothetical protein Rhsp01_02720 [Rhizobium sp. NBRC 114257]
MRCGKRQGTAGKRETGSQQVSAQIGQEAFGAGRGAGFVDQPGKGGGQIHAPIMPWRLPAVIRAGAAMPTALENK